ncbi:hypothetical protein ACE1CD_35210 [Aerosakkonema sp. BLCC-F183]|uniref:hypothetical protein n=1 Tax=Aerosakkonema sp. BLCC-F183 TaxID=3342834 RepID=UPI0035B84004
MFDYTAYNLGIHSEFTLSELMSGATKTDVVIRRGKVERTASEIANPKNLLLRANSQETCFYVPKVAACLVRGTDEIIVDEDEGVEPGLLSNFIVGLPLAMLLHLRGIIVLHASAVAVNGAVVAFLGKSGEGKSTIAATLHKRNHPLVTDDILAIDINDTTGATVLPSYPQLRLWPQSVTSIGEVAENLPRIFPNLEKRSKLVTDEFQPTPLPLKRIYVLGEGTDLEIASINTQSAFLEITRQSYPDLELLKAIGTPDAKFHRCIKLANLIPAYQIKRPRDIYLLSELAQLIEADVAKIPC